MIARFSEKKRLLAVVMLCIIIGIASFNFLILQQEKILRKYFILNPREKMKQMQASLSNSLFKYFARENKYSDLSQIEDYIKKYGLTSLSELFFIFQDKDGNLKQVSKAGVTKVSSEILKMGDVYPVTVDNGSVEGYLMVSIKEMDTAELKEGLVKYRVISYSLKLVFLLLVTALLVIILYHDYSAKMRLARDMAEIKASNDGLTKLYTHEHFMKALKIELDKVHIYNMPLTLLMMDIDYFKNFNDKYGHRAGDKVLEEVSNIIKLSTRATDILARYGGEEFAVIIPYVAKPGDIPDDKRLENFLSEVKGVAERIRKNVEDARIEFESNLLNVTVSVGIAFYHKKSSHMTVARLLQRADDALYQAKKLGRNRTHIHYEPSDF